MANPMLAPNYPTYQPPGQALGVLNQLQGLRQHKLCFDISHWGRLAPFLVGGGSNPTLMVLL